MSSPAALLVVALAGGGASGPAPVPRSVLQAADAARHAIDEGVIRIHVSVAEESGPPTDTNLEVYVRGRDCVLCVFRDGQLKGRKVLMNGERVWLIVPGTRNPVPLTPNQRLLGGASIADVARLDLAEEFDGFARDGVEPVDGTPCRVVDLKARSRTAPYASGVAWLSTGDGLLRKLSVALPSGKPAKEIRFVEYGRDAGRAVLRRMEIVHLLRSERGMRTTMLFTGYEARTLAEDFFDPARARELP